MKRKPTYNELEENVADWKQWAFVFGFFFIITFLVLMGIAIRGECKSCEKQLQTCEDENKVLLPWYNCHSSFGTGECVGILQGRIVNITDVEEVSKTEWTNITINEIVECDLNEYGYWGFKVKCDYWDWKETDKHHYLDKESCEESLNHWRFYKDCEVIK